MAGFALLLLIIIISYIIGVCQCNTMETYVTCMRRKKQRKGRMIDRLVIERTADGWMNGHTDKHNEEVRIWNVWLNE